MLLDIYQCFLFFFKFFFNKRKVNFHLLFESPQGVTFSKSLWQRIFLGLGNKSLFVEFPKP